MNRRDESSRENENGAVSRFVFSFPWPSTVYLYIKLLSLRNCSTPTGRVALKPYGSPVGSSTTVRIESCSRDFARPKSRSEYQAVGALSRATWATWATQSRRR